MRGVGVLLLTMLARMRALSSPRAASALARCVTPRHIPLVARFNPAPRLLSTDTAPQRRNAFLQTVKEAARLSEVIAESGVHVDDSGSSIKATCPFHGDGNERTPSLNIDDEQGLYHCFACGASGNVFSYLMDYENVEFKEALAMLAKRYGIRPTADEARGRGARRSSDAVVAAHERLLHALEASLVSVSATQPLALPGQSVSQSVLNNPWHGQVSQSVSSTQPPAWGIGSPGRVDHPMDACSCHHRRAQCTTRESYAILRRGRHAYRCLRSVESRSAPPSPSASDTLPVGRDRRRTRLLRICSSMRTASSPTSSKRRESFIHE